MSNNKIARRFPLFMAGIVLVLQAGPVFALEPGCQQSSPIEADTVGLIDATTGCSAIQQFGCYINDAEGDCTAVDPNDPNRKFHVYSSIDTATGAATWHLTNDADTTIKVDSALYGGASSGGNACAQFFEPDVSEGSGFHVKTNLTTSNITYLYICSDGLDEYQDSATPFTGFRSCVEGNTPGGTGTLDGSTVQCPQMDSTGAYPRSLVCNFEVDAEGQGTCEPGEAGCDAISSDFCCFCNYTQEELDAQVACDPSLNPEDCPIHTIETGDEVGITIFDGSTCGWSLVGGRKKWVCL